MNLPRAAVNREVRKSEGRGNFPWGYPGADGCQSGTEGAFP